MSEIAQFIATILFASVTNTADVFAWMLIYLELHKEWKDRVASEVAGFQAAMHPRTFGTIWRAMEAVELVTNEVLWLTASGPFIRRNIGDDLTVEDITIPKGTFIMFPAADLHRNPEMFPKPTLHGSLRRE
ncbi:cytochrome P450 [Mycena albidolilacea]|uniref:Cytochrome P450 n=1 Tax=Mycena albidolilacea TaxID=1033008 RepID=A0AAD6ZQB0_9AGAR|nr:cytochrome P450 [Mycena albidolilacea]